ncbi:MAG: FAD:protein FMN transferase [Bacteroidota bacterium]
MNTRQTIFIVFIGLILLLLSSCKQTKYHTFRGFTQGTTYQITLETKDTSGLHNAITNLLQEFDNSLSTYNTQSVISQINRNEINVGDDYFLYALSLSKEIYSQTNGAFDITVAPLVNAYGFGFTEKSAIDQEAIDSMLEFVGMEKIRLTGDEIHKQDPRLMFDMNAIAQGYSVDIVAEFLNHNKIENYLVEIGGEIRTKGANRKGEDWTIGIDKPIENNFMPGQDLQVIIRLSGKSLATSGNYRKFYEKDGVKYSHTLSPKTGKPVRRKLLSATVITDECARADALATAFMVMGLKKARQFMDEQPGIWGYFIYSDNEGNFQVSYSPELKNLIIEVDDQVSGNQS